MDQNVRLEATNEPAVVYVARNGTVWVRSHAEFFDGRFEEVREK